MSVDWQNTTFHLFCDGKTLREIAELSGFHRSTIERWSVLGQWRKRREQVWTEARLRSQNESSVKYVGDGKLRDHKQQSVGPMDHWQ